MDVLARAELEQRFTAARLAAARRDPAVSDAGFAAMAGEARAAAAIASAARFAERNNARRAAHGLVPRALLPSPAAPGCGAGRVARPAARAPAPAAALPVSRLAAFRPGGLVAWRTALGGLATGEVVAVVPPGATATVRPVSMVNGVRHRHETTVRLRLDQVAGVYARGGPASAKPTGRLFARAAKDGLALDLFGDIYPGEGGINAQMVANALRANPRGPIQMRINSVGGDVFEGMAIYTLLRDSGREITTTVLGVAASIATAIALAADHVRMSALAQWNIHNAWTFAIGSADKLEDTIKRLKIVDAQLVAIYSAKTGAPNERIERWMSDDTTMDAKTARSHGFVDEVIHEPAKKEAA